MWLLAAPARRLRSVRKHRGLEAAGGAACQGEVGRAVVRRSAAIGSLLRRRLDGLRSMAASLVQANLQPPALPAGSETEPEQADALAELPCDSTAACAL